MRFSSLSLFIGVLLTQGALGALTPDQVVTNIGIVTTVSGNINDALASLTTSSNTGTVKNVFTTVTNGFQTIIDDLAGDTTAMQATPPFPDNAAGAVIDALKDFVAVHQELLSTVIGKHSIAAQFGVTAPIAAILRSLEAGIDSFALAMIDLIPTRTSDVTNDRTSLDSSVGNTITLYTQICIPSLLFPTLPPICVAL